MCTFDQALPLPGGTTCLDHFWRIDPYGPLRGSVSVWSHGDNGYASVATPPMDDRRQHYRDDRDLVQRALRKEQAAVEDLIDELARVPCIVRAKNRRLGRPLQPEEEVEVAQEALAAIWSKLSGFQGRSKLSTWLFGFAATQVLKAIQAKRRRRMVDAGDDLEDHAAPVPTEEPRLDPAELHEALDRLDSQNAEVVRLRHFEDLSFEAVAERMDLNVNTVKARYYRSLSRLEQALAPKWRDATHGG